MKDSGNKWLGKIPAHWDLVYLWQICAEQKNKNSQNQENNVLSLSHGNIIRKKDLNYGLVPKDYVGYQIVEPGNIILRLTDLQNDQKSLRTALVLISLPVSSVTIIFLSIVLRRFAKRSTAALTIFWNLYPIKKKYKAKDKKWR